MAKKMKNAPRVQIPVDRQTPAQNFAPRVRPPVTRLPPAPQPEAPKENPQ